MAAGKTARTRLYFKRSGEMTVSIHPRLGEGARTQGLILDLWLPAQTDRRVRVLERVARFVPQTAATYRDRDPAVRHGRVLTFEERIDEDSPDRNGLFHRVDKTVGDGVFEREEIVQQIVVWLLDGSITWRTLLRNKSGVVASAKRWLRRQGVIYDRYGTLSLDAPIGEDGLTFADTLEG